MTNKDLTEKQKRFIEFYLQTSNASEAARRAGYSKKVAYSIGEENLRKPAIKEAINARLQEMDKARIADTDEVLRHLTNVLRGKETEVVVTNSGAKFTVPVAEKERLKAGEMILRVNGAFKEKVDVKVDTSQLLIETLEKVWGKNADNSNAPIP